MTKFINEKGVRIRLEGDDSQWVVLSRKPRPETVAYLAAMRDCSVWIAADVKRLDNLIPEEIVSRIRRLYVQAPLAADAGDLIARMVNLRQLTTDAALHIDFSKLQHLNDLTALWHSSWRQSLRRSALETLCVWGPKDCADLTDFVGLNRLRTLTLIQSSVSNLSGLESLPSLQTLSISHCAKLRSLSALVQCGRGLNLIELNHCPKIESYHPLARVPSLQRLEITRCAPIPSLHPFRKLTQLEFISFVNTPILDNDVAILTKFSSLRYAGFLDKRNYNAKFAKVEEVLSSNAK